MNLREQARRLLTAYRTGRPLERVERGQSPRDLVRSAEIGLWIEEIQRERALSDSLKEARARACARARHPRPSRRVPLTRRRR